MTTTTRISRKIPVFIGLCLVALVAGTLLTRGAFTRASDEKPLDVLSNPDPEDPTHGVIITWSTGNATQGQVLYSNDIDVVDKNPDVAPEETQTTSHSVKLQNLEENQTYYFKIQIGETVYDRGNNTPWSLITTSTDNLVPNGSAAGQPTPFPRDRSATPVQTLVIPAGGSAAAPTAAPAACTFTNCETIKDNFGKGCSTQDYIKCLKKG